MQGKGEALEREDNARLVPPENKSICSVLFDLEMNFHYCSNCQIID